MNLRGYEILGNLYSPAFLFIHFPCPAGSLKSRTCKKLKFAVNCTYIKRQGASMSKIYTLPELQKILTPIFRQNGVKRAILFGSYAKGLATAKSDIDLLVDSGLRGLAFFGLLEDVVTAIDAPVDLLDVSQIEKNSRIDREIRESGVAIYG